LRDKKRGTDEETSTKEIPRPLDPTWDWEDASETPAGAALMGKSSKESSLFGRLSVGLNIVRFNGSHDGAAATKGTPLKEEKNKIDLAAASPWGEEKFKLWVKHEKPKGQLENENQRKPTSPTAAGKKKQTREKARAKVTFRCLAKDVTHEWEKPRGTPGKKRSTLVRETLDTRE